MSMPTRRLDNIKRAMGEGQWMTKEEIAKDIIRITSEGNINADRLMGYMHKLRSSGKITLEGRSNTRLQDDGSYMKVYEYRLVSDRELAQRRERAAAAEASKPHPEAAEHLGGSVPPHNNS